MTIKEKHKLMVGADYKPSFWILTTPVRRFLDVKLEAPSDGVGTDSNNLMHFFWFVVRILWWSFWGAQRATGMKRVYTGATVAISLRCTSSCLALVCKASGKGTVLLLSDSKTRKCKKIRSHSLKRHSQMFEETRRIRDPDQSSRQTINTLKIIDQN